MTDIPMADLQADPTLTASQRAALTDALDNPGPNGAFRLIAAPRTRTALVERGYALRWADDGSFWLTPAGRRQVRWYVEDLAAWWTHTGQTGRTGIVTTNAVYKALQQSPERVITKGQNFALAPEVAGYENRGTSARGASRAPYWDPITARAFRRQGQGRRTDTDAGRAVTADA